MAKYFNNQKKTGKVAGSVFSIRYGETIERAYNPVVANPNTPNQVSARARLKLLSQLGAVLGPYIAIPREGAVSARNLFTKKNYGLTSYNNDEAEITLTSIQLTKSVVAFPSIVAQRSESGIRVLVSGGQYLGGLDVSRVVYVMLAKGADNRLRAVASIVVSEAGASNTYEGILPDTSAEVLVLAYGVRDNTDAARVVFGDMLVMSAQDIAKIIVSRQLLDIDVTLTETKGVLLTAQA